MANVERTFYQKRWLLVIVVIIICGLSNAGITGNKGSSTISVLYAQSVTNNNSPKLSLGSLNALRKAKIYLNTMPFSYKGLVQQLDFEGYSNSEAEYGASHCGADWNEQAAKKAQVYLNMMGFSRSGLIEQLKFEGFTQAQAEYGVSAVGY